MASGASKGASIGSDRPSPPSPSVSGGAGGREAPLEHPCDFSLPSAVFLIIDPLGGESALPALVVTVTPSDSSHHVSRAELEVPARFLDGAGDIALSCASRAATELDPPAQAGC